MDRWVGFQESLDFRHLKSDTISKINSNIINIIIK